MTIDEPTLLYRRQFILGPSYIEAFVSWTRIRISDSLKLSAHPDLPVHRASSGNASITLVGYMLDGTQPEQDDPSIVAELMGALARGGFDAVVAATEPLGGRWVLIVDDGAAVRLFTDPMGFRQVCYTNERWRGEMWCATQPELIARICGLEFDDDVVAGYINSAAYSAWRERAWPGDTTPYREISHLQPNHFLEPTERASIRFWPAAPLKKCCLEEAAATGASILSGLIDAAGRRYPLAMALSSGWDSRVLLAASRLVADQIFFYGFNHGRYNADTVVPQRLLARFGLKHHLIKYPAKMDPSFAKIYNRNFPTPHDHWGRALQPLLEKIPADSVVITGSAAELTRVRFRLEPTERLTAKNVARFTFFGIAARELERNPFVVAATNRWLQSVGETYNVHPLDLFYWEHAAGNYCAADLGEWDIVQESLTPYNCRRYLVTMLSVDERYRPYKDPIHYRMMIRNLWADVLSEPVNPPTPPGAWASSVTELRHRTAKAARVVLGKRVAGSLKNLSALGRQ
ncbi:MAG TPA: hypothetical protein VF456_26435 [Vicinamibacterales bacterium]